MVKPLIALCFLVPAVVMAGSLESIAVDRKGNSYSVSMIANLDTSADKAWGVLADLDALPKLNDAIHQISYSPSPDQLASSRAASVIRLCVLFFCKNLNQTQDLYHQPNHLHAKVIADLSDFHYGYGDWKIVDHHGSAQLHFNSSLEPKFWIPPLIGPWVIRRKLASEAVVTMENIERLANGR